MDRLLIVSNRLAINVVKRRGHLHYEPSAGGLATGLDSFYQSYESLWTGWPGITLERVNEPEREEIVERLADQNCHPVFLSRPEVENYYFGFCNKTIWPLFHYFPMYTEFSEVFWRVYQRVNEIFCDKVVEISKPGDNIWIHDYHLMLLPKLIRERQPEAKLGFFLHIPFPSFEVFRLFPWRKEVLNGLLGADLIGFHVYDYVKHFLNSVRRIVGYEHAFGQVTLGKRVAKIDAFPMGIDYKRFTEEAVSSKTQLEVGKIRRKVGDRKIVLSVDRLDYTKGILQRLETFELFLEKNPQFKEKIILILVTVPSRTMVERYRLLKKNVDELIGRINGRHGTIGWIPIWYLYRSVPFHRLVALYSIADIALVTPLRDGMNLVAKEYIASKTSGRGVLILSEMAGAAKELGEALLVNPNSKKEMTQALKEALEMPLEEQAERNKIMQKRLERYDVVRWAKDFIDNLHKIKMIQRERLARRLSNEVKIRMKNDYHKSDKRLIFLDYDGTLVSFVKNPEKAKPDEELLELFQSLSRDTKNEVVIISGRDKKTLDQWLGGFDMALIAEHGVWIKEKGSDWQTIEPLKNDWKKEIRPIFELYVDRTPGSFIEEKEFSLVWHCRKADPELALVRASELTEELLHLTSNLNLSVLEGNKVIEIKNAGINKGQAAMRWIPKGWEFILTIGDDRTDEDIFAVLPDYAYSIKVGLDASRARFNLDSVREVRLLLEDLVRR